MITVRYNLGDFGEPVGIASGILHKKEREKKKRRERARVDAEYAFIVVIFNDSLLVFYESPCIKGSKPQWK